jgi:hypothetical protein
MLKEKGKDLVTKCKPGVARIADWAHKGEHNVHLIYFFFVATHGGYQIVAAVCLAVGLLAMIHIAPADEEEEKK